MTPDPAVTVVEQETFLVPDFTVKDLLSSIPAHCFKRSALRSSSYMFWDFFVIGCAYKATTFADTYIDPSAIDLPHPALYTAARVSLWALYSFWVGLFGTGLWIVAHECGHQAFSESKALNNTVGWVLHSALGVPYHSWRISHGKHHASTGHVSLEQVYVPPTRSEVGLKPIDASRDEDLLGSRVSDEVKKELWEAVGESPLANAWGVASYLLLGWPLYLLFNSAGQRRYPKWTNHFNPNAVIFAPHQFRQIILSDIGCALWLGAIIASIYTWDFVTVFRVYLAPYLWVNHWLILITFLQHTDPFLPHYRAPEFTFPRGALCTVDRSLLGDLGSVMGWIGAHSTHGISETHILHHVSSKIPHYHAECCVEEDSDCGGMKHLDGGAVGWAEMYRVYRECKFIEDEGDVVFFKNGYGLAPMRPVFNDASASDSGIEMMGEK
ncbi:delta-12 fatty acid desaturase protein [Hymenopellis radicata]|nr:delta-12 fatty acid desaturase protein [Hymenopellis radicata]